MNERISIPKPLFCPAPPPLRPWRQPGGCGPRARNEMLGAKAPRTLSRIAGRSRLTVTTYTHCNRITAWTAAPRS